MQEMMGNLFTTMNFLPFFPPFLYMIILLNNWFPFWFNLHFRLHFEIDFYFIWI